MRLLAIITLSCAVSTANGALITFDPNDYNEGDVMNNASSHVRISTLSGGNVYSSALIGDSQQTPPGFIHSGPVGNQVFSTSPTRNTEWMASELDFPMDTISTLDNLRANYDGFLLFDFFEPVDYVSLLSLELFQDAGWGGGDDPQRFLMYDAKGNLIESRMDKDPKNLLPVGDHPDLWDDANPYAYVYNEFRASGISYLAAAGESEPTTYGRIQFGNYANPNPIPEPSPLALLALGIFGYKIRRYIPNFN